MNKEQETARAIWAWAFTHKVVNASPGQAANYATEALAHLLQVGDGNAERGVDRHVDKARVLAEQRRRGE